jgi:hypothetical protein
MITKRLFVVDEKIINFINECDKLNFKNNKDLKSLKWDWCIETGGAWFGTFTNDETMISITGIHPFKDGFRALFRSAQLYPRPTLGLSKYLMHSWAIYDHLPLQIDFSNGKPLYITTNIENDASGKMNRVHRSFFVMSKGKMVDYIGDEEIFNTWQSVWKLNVNRYYEIRKLYE